MKTSRLTSTTQQTTPEASERSARAQANSVRRVEPMEGANNNNERSLQQDLAEIDPRVVGPYQGEERRRRDVHRLAEQMLDSKQQALRLFRLDTRMRRPGNIDEVA